MTDYLNIGSSPAEEDCAQVGSPDYHNKAMAELKRYRDLIRAHCGKEPPGTKLVIKWFPHDFGTYGELVCEYQEGDEVGLSYALHVESNGPCRWDGEGATRWQNPLAS